MLSRWSRFSFIVIVLVAARSPLLAADEAKKESDPLAARVARLVRDLDVDDAAKRDAAEKELTTLDAKALEFLPGLDAPDLSAEQRKRLRSVFPLLVRKRLDKDLEGSRVQFSKGEMTLAEAAREIKKATGVSLIDVRERFDQETTNPTVKVPTGRLSFWQAVDALCGAAGLSPYLEGERRGIGFVAGAENKAPRAYAGAFRFQAIRLVLERRFDVPDQPSRCQLDLLGACEPTLTPLFLELDPAKFTIIDDKGRRVQFSRPQTIPIAIDPNELAFTFSLPLAAPEHDAKALARIDGELLVLLPGRRETFRFAKLDAPASQSRADVTVKIEPLRVEDGVWAAPVFVSHPPEDPSVETNLQASLTIEAFLESKDQKRFDHNGGASSLVDEPGRTGTEYLFVDVPGEPNDYQLVVTVPVGLTRVPVKLSLRDMPLP